jgi:hypothetical protein
MQAVWPRNNYRKILAKLQGRQDVLRGVLREHIFPALFWRSPANSFLIYVSQKPVLSGDTHPYIRSGLVRKNTGQLTSRATTVLVALVAPFYRSLWL